MFEKYDPNIHHRRSVRLDGYDYSQEGWYFVTICTQDRRSMFGEVIEFRMQLNNSGLMIESWWRKLDDKFPIVRTDEYIIMPNHFHGIVNVGAAPCGRPPIENESGQPRGIVPTLADIVHWFKTMTTNQYILGVKRGDWLPFHKKLCSVIIMNTLSAMRRN